MPKIDDISQLVITTCLPTVEQAGAIAVHLSENTKPSLSAKEQAFFVAGFQECIKVIQKMM